MPFPTDEQIMATAGDLVAQLHGIFGEHPGFRPAHAKGICLSGVFTPTAEAAKLSSGPHFNKPSTPITIRFSNSTGIPNIPDNDANADPRGIAIRFNLGEPGGKRVHTDIVSHSTPFFPTRTGAEFLEFLRALVASPAGAESPTAVEKFLGAHPETLAFVQAPKPAPVSYATETYYSVTAFKLINAAGKETFIRYRVIPGAGMAFADEATLKDASPDYLRTELSLRLKKGPIVFHLMAQIAEEGDVTNNATIHWPESRKMVELGTLEIDSELPDDAAQQKYMIFDPIPRVQGVDVSEDPLLEMRAAVYLLSGKQRRAAP